MYFYMFSMFSKFHKNSIRKYQTLKKFSFHNIPNIFNLKRDLLHKQTTSIFYPFKIFLKVFFSRAGSRMMYLYVVFDLHDKVFSSSFFVRFFGNILHQVF